MREHLINRNITNNDKTVYSVAVGAECGAEVELQKITFVLYSTNIILFLNWQNRS